MGVQFIFVVETNKKCKSDWIYIRDTINHFYEYDKINIKLNVVYMEGKGKYKYKEKEIKSLTSQYKAASKENKTNVIYCFDCDDYNKNKNDTEFLKNAKQYCDEKDYEFVWFCKDIEQVYIGKKVADNDKKKEAEVFKAKKLIKGVDAKKLSVNKYQINSSNILNILGKYKEFVRKT